MPGDGPITFGLRQVNGSIDLEPGGPADCKSTFLLPGETFTTPYIKFGAFAPDDPDAGFYARFLNQREFMLPAGAWDIRAVLKLSLTDCADDSLSASAVVRVTVLP